MRDWGRELRAPLAGRGRDPALFMTAPAFADLLCKAIGRKAGVEASRSVSTTIVQWVSTFGHDGTDSSCLKERPMRKTYPLMGIAMAVACCGCNAGNPSNADVGGKAAPSTKSESSAAESENGAGGEQIRDNAVPEQRAGSVRLTRLSGAEIRRRLVGRRIMPDRNVRQPYPAFSEDFRPDGTWASNRAELRVVDLSGKWRIVGDRICVTMAHTPRSCRDVWADSANRIAMRNVRGPQDTILIMSTSPIR